MGKNKISTGSRVSGCYGPQLTADGGAGHEHDGKRSRKRGRIFGVVGSSATEQNKWNVTWDDGRSMVVHSYKLCWESPAAAVPVDGLASVDDVDSDGDQPLLPQVPMDAMADDAAVHDAQAGSDSSEDEEEDAPPVSDEEGLFCFCFVFCLFFIDFYFYFYFIFANTVATGTTTTEGPVDPNPYSAQATASRAALKALEGSSVKLAAGGVSTTWEIIPETEADDHLPDPHSRDAGFVPTEFIPNASTTAYDLFMALYPGNVDADVKRMNDAMGKNKSVSQGAFTCKGEYLRFLALILASKSFSQTGDTHTHTL
jgi:hypothetical protein